MLLAGLRLKRRPGIVLSIGLDEAHRTRQENEETKPA